VSDNRKCSHGVLYTDECDECEKISLINKLEWMKPIVVKAEKRLEELNGITNTHKEAGQ
jgi:hypothetical protein